jgi:hypothetical protein
MLESYTKNKMLESEVVRLRTLQKNLKRDIAKYKRIVEFGTLKRGLTEDEKDRLLENFYIRLQRNSWILKKIIFEIKRNKI